VKINWSNTFAQYDVPTVTRGHYFIFGVHHDAIDRLWPNIYRGDVMDALEEHGIYHRHYATWWFKLGAWRKALTDSASPDDTPDPVGGIKSRYQCDYYAHCKDGEIVRLLKDRHGRELKFEDLYIGDPSVEAAIRARVEKAMGVQTPYGPPEELHKVKYGVLYPRNGIGRPLDRATIDVLDAS
jgi:hypothetical protein